MEETSAGQIMIFSREEEDLDHQPRRDTKNPTTSVYRKSSKIPP